MLCEEATSRGMTHYITYKGHSRVAPPGVKGFNRQINRHINLRAYARRTMVFNPKGFQPERQKI